MSAVPGQERTAEATFRASAYPAWGRLAAATAFVASRSSLPGMLLAMRLSRAAVMPLTVIRWFVLFFVLPALAARIVARAFRAEVRVSGEGLRIDRAGVRIDVDRSAIAGLRPWSLPLPTAGFDVRLASGGGLGHGIATSEPRAILRALADLDVPGAANAVEHPTVAYAEARAAYGRWRWPHLLARFPLFALGPAALLFNLHQHIAYGGTLGQYYQLGLRAYVTTFAVYWATVTIYQAIWASLWRGPAELVCLAAAAVAPSRAARVRRATELAIRVLYYGGVPALLALRFAPW